MILVPLIMLVIFVGLAMILAVVVGGILLSTGKLTLPHTNARKLMRTRTEVEVAKMQLEIESLRFRQDAAIQLRLEASSSGDYPKSNGEVSRMDVYPTMPST